MLFSIARSFGMSDLHGVRHWGLWPLNSTQVVCILCMNCEIKTTVVIFTLSCTVCTWRELIFQRPKKYSDYVDIFTLSMSACGPSILRWHSEYLFWDYAHSSCVVLFFGCRDAVQSMRQAAHHFKTCKEWYNVLVRRVALGLLLFRSHYFIQLFLYIDALHMDAKSTSVCYTLW